MTSTPRTMLNALVRVNGGTQAADNAIVITDSPGCVEGPTPFVHLTGPGPGVQWPRWLLDLGRHDASGGDVGGAAHGQAPATASVCLRADDPYDEAR